MHGRRWSRVAVLAALLVATSACDGVELPDISLPDISLPDVSLPDLTLPDVTVPDFDLPGSPDATSPAGGDGADPSGTAPPGTAAPAAGAPEAPSTTAPTAPPATADPPATDGTGTTAVTETTEVTQSTGVPETTGAAIAGTDPDEAEQADSLLPWLIAAIVAVLAALGALVVWWSRAPIRRWDEQATEVYLEARRLADGLVDGVGDEPGGPSRPATPALLASIHRLELEAPTESRLAAIRDVGSAIVGAEGAPDRPAQASGADRVELLAALDALGDLIGRRR